MTGARIVEVLRESAASVLRTHGIDPAQLMRCGRVLISVIRDAKVA